MRILIFLVLTSLLLVGGVAKADEHCLTGVSAQDGLARVLADDGSVKLAQSLVCRVGHKACKGACGNVCYNPSRGEQCLNGTVCRLGHRACGCRCYNPSRGETCN